MDEIIKSLIAIGGPTAIVAAVGMWFYLRADSQRMAAETFLRDMLTKNVEANLKVANSIDAMVRAVERRAP